MYFNSLCLILLVLSATVYSCTHRQARARIINRTGRKIETLILSHKYSDNYKNSKEFHDIDHNSYTNVYLTVDYHTGFMCNGKDWWWLSWLDSNGYVHTIDPKNGRCIIDEIERFVRVIGNTVSIGNPSAYIMNQILQRVTNDGSTCGFKQHILESDDDGEYVDITLYSYTNNGVELKSPSGKSTTDYESKWSHVRHDEN